MKIVSFSSAAAAKAARRALRRGALRRRILTAVRQADWTDEGLILDYEMRDDVVFVKRLGGRKGA